MWGLPRPPKTSKATVLVCWRLPKPQEGSNLEFSCVFGGVYEFQSLVKRLFFHLSPKACGGVKPSSCFNLAHVVAFEASRNDFSSTLYFRSFLLFFVYFESLKLPETTFLAFWGVPEPLESENLELSRVFWGFCVFLSISKPPRATFLTF